MARRVVVVGVVLIAVMLALVLGSCSHVSYRSGGEGGVSLSRTSIGRDTETETITSGEGGGFSYATTHANESYAATTLMRQLKQWAMLYSAEKTLREASTNAAGTENLKTTTGGQVETTRLTEQTRQAAIEAEKAVLLAPPEVVPVVP